MSSTGTTHHLYAEGYSGSNPVPTVQGFREQQAERENADNPPPPGPSTPESTTAAASPPASPMTATTDVDVEKDLPIGLETPHADDHREARASTNNNGNAGTSEEKKGETKREITDKATAHKVKPTDRLKKSNKAEHTVRDPVTGLDVIIHDADFSSGFQILWVLRRQP
jgi:hypothetical protein